MKKIFTFALAAFAAVSSFAQDIKELDLSTSETLVAQADGSYALEYSKTWDWKNLVWLATSEGEGEDAVTIPFDATAYNYLVVEYAQPLTFTNKIIVQNTSWAGLEASSAAGATVTNVALTDAFKPVVAQICGQSGNDFGTAYISRIYFSTEKVVPATQDIAVTSVGNVVDNGDGTYTIPAGADGWGWNGAWLGGSDWSDYNYLIAELAEPVEEGQAKIQIQYGNGAADTEAYNAADATSIVAALDETGKANVSQFALQGGADYKVTKLYLSKTEPTGISNIKADTKAQNDKMFNLAGQQVDKNYRGIVIQNGKKFFNK